MKPIFSENAPQVVGPYSQAIQSGALIFCSGQIGIDPSTGTLVSGIEAQTHQVMKNIAAVLEAAGSSLQDVMKTTIFLADMQDYKKVNELYAGYFTEQKPARSTVQVAGLPLGALIEIEVVASKE